MSPYNDKIVDHFMHPRNVGEIPDADGMGTVGHPSCGDIVRFYLKVEQQGGRRVISQIRFKTFGCTTAIATSSVATEMVQGKTIEEALQLKNEEVAEALGGLPTIKMHCSVLAEDALRAAIGDYLKKVGDDHLLEEVKSQSRKHEEKELLTRIKSGGK
ncbi:MAG: iron-sulfur cluster assembly scaffold protein [Elusimicrobia bacterium]|nr:iron-sulfur cluster assembly scaffold protein [Elusimicrobiota bacterium]MBI3013191.1 iron-sulfur cluster assembly scaffold protein [Elusimicrobiota bacterium]MBI4218410.1 iron-sulfur cluster assembly scaffold protein [Elusimicrobiota bacterium]